MRGNLGAGVVNFKQALLVSFQLPFTMALTKNVFSSGAIGETVEWFTNSYPISDMGRSADRSNRTKIIVDSSYRIIYLDHNTVKTQRVIDVLERM